MMWTAQAPVDPRDEKETQCFGIENLGGILRRSLHPVLAHHDDTGGPCGLADHQRSVAPAIGPDLHRLFRITQALGRVIAAKLLFQLGIQALTGFARHFGKGVRDLCGAGTKQDSRDERHAEHIKLFSYSAQRIGM